MSERKATIYDYARMCNTLKTYCNKCPLGSQNNGNNLACAVFTTKHPNKSNEIILKWCDEHPKKTRQDEFLKMFPNARINCGILRICPKDMGSNIIECAKIDCINCRTKYWLEEI